MNLELPPGFAVRGKRFNTWTSVDVQVFLPLDEVVESAYAAGADSRELLQLLQNDVTLEIEATKAASFKVRHIIRRTTEATCAFKRDYWAAFNIPVDVHIRTVQEMAAEDVRPYVRLKAFYDGALIAHEPVIVLPGTVPL